MSWRETKDAGRQAVSDGKYPEALAFYSKAIDQLLSSDDEGGNADNRAGGGHANEHQILLSNVIACSLKIGGEDMVAKAVDNAKQCVALNNKWPKAHVRLASAYIALGGHSNDACLSLQRALSLDRNYKVAREMLVKEMRQRNNRERTGNSNSSDEGGGHGERTDGSRSSTPTTSENDVDPGLHPTDETPRHFSATPSAPPYPADSTNDGNYDGIDVDDIDPPDVYDSLPISGRIQHQFSQLVTWFYSQSDDAQTLFKVAVCFLVLYVALGGRFGLDYALGGEKSVGHRGNYEGGNAYDRYSPSSRYSSSSNAGYQDSRRQQAGSAHNKYDYPGRASSGYNDRTNPQNDKHYSQGRTSSGYNDRRSTHNDRYYSNGQTNSGYNDRTSSHNDRHYSHGQTSSGYNDQTGSHNDRHYSHYEDEHYYEPRARRSRTSYQMPSLNDGSMVSMGIMVVIVIICQRLGMNPLHAMGMLRLMHGRAGHRMGRWGYGAYQGGMGGGMGMGGGGFGFGQRRYGMGRRGRGGFY